MNVEEKGNVRRAANYRKRREAQGESQVTVWLGRDLLPKLDNMIAEGRFKNRSDLVAHAIREFELNRGN